MCFSCGDVAWRHLITYSENIRQCAKCGDGRAVTLLVVIVMVDCELWKQRGERGSDAHALSIGSGAVREIGSSARCVSRQSAEAEGLPRTLRSSQRPSEYRIRGRGVVLEGGPCQGRENVRCGSARDGDDRMNLLTSTTRAQE